MAMRAGAAGTLSALARQRCAAAPRPATLRRTPGVRWRRHSVATAVATPRLVRPAFAFGVGVASASAGLCASCRCDSRGDGASGAEGTPQRERKGRLKKRPKKDAEEPPNEDAPPTKQAPDRKGDKGKRQDDEDAKKKRSKKKKQAKEKENEGKAVATPRVEPLLELRHRQRMVFISGSISDSTAKAVIADLLYLDALEDGTTDPGGPKPIQLVINSSGGVVTSGLAIYDVMQYVRSPVHTLCIGHASSMAAILLAAGEPGHRRALPHARMMIHSASGGYSRSKVEDVMVHAEELKAKNDLLAAILARHLGVSVEKVMEMWRIDNYMTCDRPFCAC
eukprot:COSAG02_NODE_2663_length_8302_cov_44.083994_8_plen_336_part_00